MFNDDCLLIYERYKVLYEIREKLYKIRFSDLDFVDPETNEHGKYSFIEVTALNPEEAKKIATERMLERDPNFRFDLIFSEHIPWPKDSDYLHHAIEDEDGYDAT